MLLRLLNIMVITLMPFCVYITFSVKNDVYNMQKKADELTQKIVHEKEMVAIYRAEWASLTAAGHISGLRKNLMPEYHAVSYAQMVRPSHLPRKDIYPVMFDDSDIYPVSHLAYND